MSEPLITLENISVKYGHIEALRDLDLSIHKDEFIGIVGDNGGGKSTLLKTILGLVKPYRGTIKYQNTSLKKSSLHLGYVPQLSEVNRIFPITVKEVVLMAKIPVKNSLFYRFSEKDQMDIDEILKKVGIQALQERQISDLSGGEFQKMMIARALAMNPDILLLDEPTAMIDIKSQKQIYSIIKRLSNDMTIIVVTHHVKDITRRADRLIYLNKNIIASGDPEEVYTYAYGKKVKRTFHLVEKRGGKAK